jgi:hypothetical protein
MIYSALVVSIAGYVITKIFHELSGRNIYDKLLDIFVKTASYCAVANLVVILLSTIGAVEITGIHVLNYGAILGGCGVIIVILAVLGYFSENKGKHGQEA